MKNLKVTIEWNEKNDPSKGYSIISTPWVFTVEFNEAKTSLYNEFKSQSMLLSWCQQIVEIQYPLYKGIVTKVTVR